MIKKISKTPHQKAEIKAEKKRKLLAFFKANPMTFTIEKVTTK